MNSWQKIKAVVWREVRIWRRRPIYLVASIGCLAFCATFFLTLFRDGLPHDLPIAVVDEDNSSMSRSFSQQLDATQLGRVIKYSNFEEAREDMMRGKVTAVCLIPEGMFADVNASRRPTFTFYYNAMYFIGGNLTYQNILTMVNLVNGAVQRQVLRSKGMNEEEISGHIRPIQIDTHKIGNVYANYAYCLSNIMLPGFLELIVIIILIYSLGTELKYGTSKHLMEESGGSIVIALHGKLVIYTALFTTLGFLLIVLLYHWMHFPIAGSIWNMLLGIFLLVLSAEGAAIFILGCLPIPRLALSIGALYSVLAFSLTGFSLTLEALPPYIQGLSVAFPLRHYYVFYVHEVIYGTGFEGWWREIVHLSCFMFLPLLVLNRLKGAYIYQNFPTN